MNSLRRRLAALLATGVLCVWQPAEALAAPARPLESVPAAVPSAAGASATQEASRNIEAENHPIRRGDGNGPLGATRLAAAEIGRGLSGGWSMWLRTLGVLGVVLAIMGLAFKWLRKAGLGRSFGGSTAAVQILSRGYLTNRHQMVLVRFGERVLLLGLGPQNLDVLSEVTDPLEAAQLLARVEGARSDSPSQEFQRTIDEAVRQYQQPQDAAPVERPVEPSDSEPRIGTLRHELQSLLSRMQSMGKKQA